MWLTITNWRLKSNKLTCYLKKGEEIKSHLVVAVHNIALMINGMEAEKSIRR